jgi:RNA:NAD 2'-phosphotransferase (TPT1/KptA family)
MSQELAKRSRALSYWLRHAPEKGGLRLDPAG